MHRHPFLLPSCALVVLLLQPVASRAQAPASEPAWGVEFAFGSAGMDPRDLNALSANRQAIYGVDYNALFRFYSINYGQNITVTTSNEGALPIIDRTWTGGVRATRRLGRRLAAVVAFDYLSQAREARLRTAWQLTAYNPNAVAFPTLTGLSTDLSMRVSVRSYAALGGIRWRVWSRGSLGIDAIAAAGPGHATCAITQGGTQTSASYGQSTSWTGRMDGKSWHATAEAGAHLDWRLARRWTTFVEGTYRYERFPSVTGTSEMQSARRDGDAASAEYETSGSTSGRWQMVPYQATVQGKAVNQPYPVVGGSGSAFVLDLSGARLRAGLAVRFGAPR